MKAVSVNSEAAFLFAVRRSVEEEVSLGAVWFVTLALSLKQNVDTKRIRG